MSDANRVAELIEQMANQYEGMKEASSILREIGSIDNHLMELRRSRDAALEEAKVVEAKRTKMREELAQAQDTHRKAKETLRQEHEELKATLQTNLTGLEKDARAKLDALTQATNDQIAKDLAAHHTVINDLVAQRDAHRERVRLAEQDAVAIEAKRTESQLKYDQVKAAIAAIRA